MTGTASRTSSPGRHRRASGASRWRRMGPRRTVPARGRPSRPTAVRSPSRRRPPTWSRATRTACSTCSWRGRAIDQLARVSVGVGTTEADGPSLRPSFALNARLVAFESTATNLVSGDTNGTSDIFVRDRRPPQPKPTPTPTPTPTPVVKPAIVVSPNPVDFGSVPIGTLGVMGAATILSVGTGPAQIGAIAISGQNAGDFLLSANPCTGTSLAPGASCALGLLFIGTATGIRTALLSVASDAGPAEVVHAGRGRGCRCPAARPARRPLGHGHDRDGRSASRRTRRSS